MSSASKDRPERREASRQDLRLDMTVDGAEAVTENISSSGVLLRIPEDLPVGSEFIMELEIPTEFGGPTGRMRFLAEVIRVEDREEGRAIAGRFLDWRLVD